MGSDDPALRKTDAPSQSVPITISLEKDWSLKESAYFGDPLLDNLAVYARHGVEAAEVFIAKARREDKLIGVAPVVVIHKYQSTRLLVEPYRRILNPIFGPLARMTICIVDTTFMGYRNTDPIVTRDPACLEDVSDALFRNLKSRTEYDAIMLSMPEYGRTWMTDQGFRVFSRLPLTTIDLSGFQNFDAYVAGLSKTRRRTVMRDRRAFENASVSVYAPPLKPELALRLHDCLEMSALKNASRLEVPFNALMNSKPAFLEQKQWVIVAAVRDRIAGFFSFLQHDGKMHQLHGGLNYEVALDVRAYPNLMYAAIEQAIDSGCQALTLGALNNGTKARIAKVDAVAAGFWPRTPRAGLLLHSLVLRKLQIYKEPE